MTDKDEFFMGEALKQAKRAYDADEVPIGAVIVFEGKIIAKAHNQTRTLNDPTAHAEMIAITQAASYFNAERIVDTTLYATVEPCIMCAGALVWARVKRVVFGTHDEKAGGCGSVCNILQNKVLNHRADISCGVLQDECRGLMQDFFRQRRLTQSKENN